MNPDTPLTPKDETALQIELSRLAEKFDFDAMQLCATKFTPGKKGMSQMATAGVGNLYARLAVTERWVNAVHMEFDDMDCDTCDVTIYECGDDDEGPDDFLGNTK